MCQLHDNIETYDQQNFDRHSTTYSIHENNQRAFDEQNKRNQINR